MDMKKNVALVLGSAGARGLAHIGELTNSKSRDSLTHQLVALSSSFINWWILCYGEIKMN